MQHGWGRILKSDRSVYIGWWKDSMKHGYGKFYEGSGAIKEGYWEKDKFRGNNPQYNDGTPKMIESDYCIKR